jgi:geranylgeranyl pyrophosphate synthase
VSLDGYLEVRRQAVESSLALVLAHSPAPPVILEAMRYSLLGGGKRLRPLLALAACEATHRSFGQAAWAPAMPAACAVEMIHTYSLIHDDLPAMDDDAMRRGRATSHVVFGEGMAILAGDALQAEAFATLARAAHGATPDDAVRVVRALQIIAEAAGSVGMVGGQAIDLAHDPVHRLRRGPTQDAFSGERAELDAEGLTDMHARKTGALIRASVASGAVLGGADASTLAHLDAYASAIGLAFQIVDDILDVEGASVDLGKTAGKDAASGKPTYVGFYGVDGARQRAADCLARSDDALAAASVEGRYLRQLATWVVERRT